MTNLTIEQMREIVEGADKTDNHFLELDGSHTRYTRLASDHHCLSDLCTIIELHEENERLREALIKSQDWDWISAREDNEECGRDYFEIPEMQELHETAREGGK